MLLLISAPVILTVVAVYRWLQRHAPTTRLVRHARAAAPTLGAAGAHLGLGVGCLVALRAVDRAIEAGAPDVLYLLVLVLAWDAVKLLGSAALLLAGRPLKHFAAR